MGRTICLRELLLGTEGTALFRHLIDCDQEFAQARVDRIRWLIEHYNDPRFAFGIEVPELDVATGYTAWAPIYDTMKNGLIEAEEPLVDSVTRELPIGRALDAACGTGRHAAYLHDRGCTVTGVDQSLEMLAVARNKLPEVHFEQGDIEQLAFADGSFDLVVIALALCHLADPTAAVAELARVLRPGGTLVIADPHPAAGVVGGQAFYGSIVPGRPMTWVRNHYHQASTWLRAFRAAGLQVDDCIEPPMGAAQIASSPASRVFPDATRIAVEDLPGLWVWELRRSFSEG
jgi:ubiquinone/menaquinone biosynthesis C-methylase UbiE